MSQIHPSAVIDSQVEMAEDVYVGPGCVFEGKIKIGSGNHFTAGVYLKGPMEIGKSNRFYPNAYYGHEPQDKKFDPNTEGAGTVIGDENIFREGVSIHRATADIPTRVGNGNYLMVNTHLAHDVQLSNDCVLGNGVLIAGHAKIADKVIFGGNAVVHQFVRMGRMSLISGAIGITQDLPPFCVSYNMRSTGSLNIVGLRRNGHRASIKPLKQAFELFFRSGLSNKHAAKRVIAELGDNELCKEFADFVLTTQRGISPLDPQAKRQEIK